MKPIEIIMLVVVTIAVGLTMASMVIDMIKKKKKDDECEELKKERNLYLNACRVIYHASPENLSELRATEAERDYAGSACLAVENMYSYTRKLRNELEEYKNRENERFHLLTKREHLDEIDKPSNIVYIYDKERDSVFSATFLGIDVEKGRHLRAFKSDILYNDTPSHIIVIFDKDTAELVQYQIEPNEKQ